jgi:hypothetical protein
MAGTVDLLQRAFTGLETRGDALRFGPCLPDALAGMRFLLRYRVYPEVEVTITHERLTLGGSAQQAAVLPFRVRDDEYRPRPSRQPRGAAAPAPFRPRLSDQGPADHGRLAWGSGTYSSGGRPRHRRG